MVLRTEEELDNVVGEDALRQTGYKILSLLKVECSGGSTIEDHYA